MECLVGAFEAIKLARERIRSDPDIKGVHPLPGHSAVVDGILGLTPASSQGAYMGFRKIAKDLSPNALTKVAWVPGHKDIHGNEVADKLAKEGSELPTPPSRTTTITHIKVGQKREEAAPGARLGPKLTALLQALATRRPSQTTGTQLPRAILHRLYAERTGHGDFVEYHERFGHNTRPTCRCGELRTQGHFVEAEWSDPSYRKSLRKTSGWASPPSLTY